MNQSTHRVNCKQHNQRTMKGDHSFFNPLGAVSAIAGSESKGLCIVLDFMKFAHTVVYPTEPYVLECAMNHPDRNVVRTQFRGSSWGDWQPQVEELISRDALYELYDEDKELLWEWRYIFLMVHHLIHRVLVFISICCVFSSGLSIQKCDENVNTLL